MKKLVGTTGLFLLISVISIMLTCGESDPPSGTREQAPGSSIFSGDWQGVVYVQRLGECNISGESYKQFNIHMTWEISRDGNIINIHENLFNSKWIGMIGESHEFSANKICTFIKGENMSIGSCPTDMVCDTIYYHGMIEEIQQGRYKLEMESEENWCPDNDCRFKVKYYLNNRI